MHVRFTVILSALIMGPALLIGAAHAADAGAARIHPQIRAVPGAKTECPSGPADPATERGLRPQPEPPSEALAAGKTASPR